MYFRSSDENEKLAKGRSLSLSSRQTQEFIAIAYGGCPW